MGAGQLPGGAQSQGQVRPVVMVETVVSVTNAEVTLKAANTLRRNLVVCNAGATVLRVYTTTTGLGGVLLAQNETWNAFQDGVGCYKGAVFGIRAIAGALDALVTEET